MRIVLFVSCCTLACGSNQTDPITSQCAGGEPCDRAAGPNATSTESSLSGTTTTVTGSAVAAASAGGAASNTSNAATSGGTSSTAQGAGAANNGAGGAATGGGGASTGTTTGGGGTTSVPGDWHAETASQITASMLTEEYEYWKYRFVEDCSNGSAVVLKEGSVVSEGIAYGMLLAANFNDRVLLDGLWQYYTDHLDSNGLMNWATGVCDEPGDNNANAATDAELDAAMALIQAHALWPDGGYLSAAEDLTGKILEHETDICDDQLVLLPGDAWGGCNDNDTRINPSYFAPGYYRVFAAKFPAQAEQWNQLLEGTYALYASYQASSPLVPDWDNHPYGDEAGLENYYYDACRTPWRVAVDYAWAGEMRSATFLQNVASWVDQNGGIPGPGGTDNNSAFNGAFALTGVTDQAKLDGYVSQWLTAEGDDVPYFQATLRVLYLLVAGGRFPSTL